LQISEEEEQAELSTKDPSTKERLLHCMDNEEASKVMEEMHEGDFDPHMNGLMMAKKIIRKGYYWPTLDKDCENYVRKRCFKCQEHVNGT